MPRTFSFVWALTAVLGAQADLIETPGDTSRFVHLDEAVVIAPKENLPLRRQPVSASSFGKEELRERQITNIRQLSALAPSFYMPAYGSRLTGATYIRGIGSRSNTPAVGLYVDNMPYLDKSAYTYNFHDIARIDVLRGPQGTLYGRNTMGGLVRIQTTDPLSAHGTDIALGASTRNGGHHVGATTYLHASPRFAASVGGYYEGANGFFRNAETGERADKMHAIGFKTRLAWKATDALRLDLNASYEHSHEYANPYAMTEDTIPNDPVKGKLGTIFQNRKSYYNRDLLNLSLGAEWKLRPFVLSSLTSYQYQSDNLTLDQDFTSFDFFSITQKQHIHNFSEELAVKSHPGKRWEWTTGAFFATEQQKYTVPVTFFTEGVGYVNSSMSAGLSRAPMGMSLAITDPSIVFDAHAKTPTTNAAIFHQSTFHDLLVPRLSLIVGARLDYDYQSVDLMSGQNTLINYNFSMMNGRFSKDMTAHPEYNGKTSEHSWQFLPKVALQYDFRNKRGNVYALLSKGYRSGGYNIQTYSDISRLVLTGQMFQGVKEYSTQMMTAMIPDAASREKALAQMTTMLDRMSPAIPDISTLHFKPEESWNYEVGTHLNFFQGNLQVDASLFLMNTRNLQITKFTRTGLGREVVNAGKGRSYGVELGVRSSSLDNRLTLTGAYSYTHAEFTDYAYSETVSYDGKRVPFTPKHTLAFSADFRQPLTAGVVKAFFVGADVQGAGSIYWNEPNTMKEDLYAVLNARAGVELGKSVSLTLWAKNLTNTNYETFSFYNMRRRFSQFGNPRHFGVELNVRF